MDFDFTPQQQALRTELTAFARDELNDDVVQRDQQQLFLTELWRKCGARRLPGLALPEPLGGAGLDPLSTAIAVEALGYGCADGGLVFALGAHLATAAIPLWKYGTPAQQARWFPQLCDGSLVGIGALTEPGAGSDAFAMQASVQRDGDAFILKGVKRYISNAPIAGLFVVYAMTDSAKGYHGGVTAFLVEKNAPGFKVTRTLPKMGVRTSPFGELTMTDLRLPRDAVLGEVGSGSAIFSTAMDWERVLLMAGNMGTMQRLFERAIKHARTRKQFGQPIGKFQAVSHRLADMKVQIEAARLLVYRAASRLERERSASLDAAIAKLFASETYVRVALDCLRTHGASGYVADNDFERAARDSVGSTIYSGTSDIQRNIIARWLGL